MGMLTVLFYQTRVFSCSQPTLDFGMLLPVVLVSQVVCVLSIESTFLESTRCHINPSGTGTWHEISLFDDAVA